MLICVIKWLLIIIAVEAIVEVIVSADITLRIRAFLSKINPGFLGKLFSCGYCMSVWVAATIAWAAPGILTESLILDIIIKTFVVHRLANILHEGISRWHKRLPFELVFHSPYNGPPHNDVIIDVEDENAKTWAKAKRD